MTTTNKLAGKQAYKPLAYAVELSPENKKQGAAGFVFDPSGNKVHIYNCVINLYTVTPAPYIYSGTYM